MTYIILYSESYKLHSEDGGYESLHSRRPVQEVSYAGYESLPRSISANTSRPLPATGITGLHGFSSRSSSLRGKSGGGKQLQALPVEPIDPNLANLYAKVDRSKKRSNGSSCESSDTCSPVSNPGIGSGASGSLIRENTKEPLYATIGSNRRPMLPQAAHSNGKMSDV